MADIAAITKRQEAASGERKEGIIEVIAISECRPDLVRIYLGAEEEQAIEYYFEEQMNLRSPATAEIIREIIHDLECLYKGYFDTPPFISYFNDIAYRKKYNVA